MNFPAMWSNKISTEERDNILSRSFNFCYQKIFEAPKRSDWNFSAILDQNNSTEKRDIPPSIQKQISLPELFWNNEELAMKIYGTVTQRKSTYKRDIPRVSHDFFSYLNFSETPKSCHWVFLVMRGQNNSVEKRDIPPCIQ